MSVLVLISLLAPFIANDKPLLVKYKESFYFPVFSEYPETFFGGDFYTEADYRDQYVQDLIVNNGIIQEGLIVYSGDLEEAEMSPGWLIWPIIPFSYNTINYDSAFHPSPPSKDNLLGTDDQGRDVLARVIYGFRLSLFFGICVSFISAVIGVSLGAFQGYFGGNLDIVLQRFVEVWSQIPYLYLIMIIGSVFSVNLLVLLIVLSLFDWTSFCNIVRAEFLRARNFEYVMAAKAMGVPDILIVFRHILPNAAVATLVILPFSLTGSISALASLDFLGFGLPSSYPSLGELALQGKNNLHAPWLGITAFFSFAVMLSLLVFIFEAIRDAFDPRKVFLN